MAKAKFRCMKFDGDDAYSWAVFRSEDVRGLRSPVFWGQARPIVTGCSRGQANYHRRLLEERAATG